MRTFVLIFTLLLLTVPAFPTTITTFTTDTLWQQATSAFQTIDFEGLAASAPGWGGTYAPGSFGTYTDPGGSGVQITASSSNLDYAYTPSGPWYNFNTDVALALLAGSGTFHLTLPSGITAVAVNLMNQNASGYTVTVAGNIYPVPTYASPTPGFFGATFDTPITTIDFASPATSWAFIDNIQFGVAKQAGSQGPSDTPELATMLMIGSGLIMFRFVRRKFPRFAAS